eukprot:Gb_05650 [translate_table: standard]
MQLQLLSNGFRLLKTGGTLVYSTCSLTTAQNEDVLEQFLSKNPDAEHCVSLINMEKVIDVLYQAFHGLLLLVPGFLYSTVFKLIFRVCAKGGYLTAFPSFNKRYYWQGHTRLQFEIYLGFDPSM